MLDEGFAVRAMFRVDADAEAATNAEGITLDYHFSSQSIHDPLSGNRCVGNVLYIVHHDEEFVTSEPGNRVLFAPPCFKPFCNAFQKEVAGRVSKRVINVFEPVEIEEKKCNFAFFAASTG
jgi:hypothetical protein